MNEEITIKDHIANDIVNHFMHKGAVVRKADFDFVMEQLSRMTY